MHRYTVIGMQEGYMGLRLHQEPRAILERLIKFWQSPVEVLLEPKLYMHKHL